MLSDDEDELDWDLDEPSDKPAAEPAPLLGRDLPVASVRGPGEALPDAPTDRPPADSLVDEDDEIYDERTWGDLLGETLSPGDVLAEKYRIDELIGYGAMGFVLKARHMQLDEPVAVKFLLPELAASHEALVRFEREARAAFKIRSEHVARVLDVGRLGSGQPFMVMEYLEGIELGEKVYDQQMHIPELVDYMVQACDAMAEAHALDIVHRDVKPDNLFLVQRRDGTTCVKVLDFGLSKVVSDGKDGKRQKALTADAQVLGTAHYMSPEQWVASKHVGPSADIWALGVILYEAITGESPFMRNNLAAMCNAVLRDDPPPLADFRADVPDGLEEVVRKCIAKKVEDRYLTVSDLANDLLPFMGEQARPPSRFSAPPPSPFVEVTAKSEPPLHMRDTIPAPKGGSKLGDGLPAGGMPPLGLATPDGVVETWADILESAPSDGGSKAWVWAAMAVVIAIAAYVALS